jgi:non-homologous end joining protein Ku
MPRPYWKGQLRLALVTCGVELVSTITGGDKIRLNCIERGTETRYGSAWSMRKRAKRSRLIADAQTGKIFSL